MILPDSGDTGEATPAAHRATLIGATVVFILLGFAALGWLTAPDTPVDDEVAAPIDDEFSVGQIEQGPKVENAGSVHFDIGIPLALTRYDGELYLFASGTTRADPSGMLAWVSEDGLTWTFLGEVIGDEHVISTMSSTSDGLVAAGRRDGDTGVTIWTSPDGLEWTAVESPPLTEHPYLVPEPTMVKAATGGVVVAGRVEPDRERLLEDHLSDAGVEVDLASVSWDTRRNGDGDAVLSVYGPLGTPALTRTLGDLGLDEEESELVDSRYDDGPGTSVWVYRENAGWETGNIDTHIHSMLTRPDGNLIALASDTSHTSIDGLQWQTNRVEPTLGMATIWRDSLAGVTADSPFEILVSDDGLTWGRTGVGSDFPAALDWEATAFSAGQAGIAAAVEARTGSVIRPMGPAALTATNGATLTLNFVRGLIRLEVADSTRTWVWDRGDAISEPEGIVADLGDRVVTLADPDTGTSLATFTFEELTRTKNRYSTERFEPLGHQAIVFSKDGESWSIQDVATEVGNDSRIHMIDMIGNRLVTVARHGREPFTPYPVPGFDVWTVELP